MLPSSPCRSNRFRKASTVMCRSARSRSPLRSTYPSTPPTHSVSRSASTHSSSPLASSEFPSSSCRRSSSESPPTKLTTAAVSGSCAGFARRSRAAFAAAFAAARRASRRTLAASRDPAATGARFSYVIERSPRRSSARTNPSALDSFSCANTARKVSPFPRTNVESPSRSPSSGGVSEGGFVRSGRASSPRFFFIFSSSSSSFSEESLPRRMFRAKRPRNPPRLFLGLPSRIACASECTSIVSGPESTPLRSS
mmetsp:Transcript_12119/g.48637  ORF Transcript_12119/g.48637 Transcript_12119/m.48637 type:complete len:254 (-) Transcript_12119:701-1462(-)